jgi:hypothetical protein
MHLRIEDECTYGFAGIRESRFEVPKEGRLDYIRRRFAKFGGQVESYLAVLQTDEQIHVGPIEWVELGECSDGEWFLLEMLLMLDHPT